MSCGVGCRCGSYPVLLWLWCRLAAIALFRSLAWEPPYALDAALTKKKKKKKNLCLASEQVYCQEDLIIRWEPWLGDYKASSSFEIHFSMVGFLSWSYNAHQTPRPWKSWILQAQTLHAGCTYHSQNWILRLRMSEFKNKAPPWLDFFFLMATWYIFNLGL